MRLNAREKQHFKDPLWRLQNIYRIKDKNEKTVKFRLNHVQKILARSDHRLEEVLKARQLGISTFYLLKYLDRTIWNKNMTTAILSHKRESMEKLFSIIRRAVKYMRDDIRPVIDKGGGSKYEIRFPDVDSKIYMTMEAVSDTVNNLHVSEIGLMDNDDRVKTSLDAVTKDGMISYESTPRGFNHFYDHWVDDNGFAKHFFPWFFDPYYSLDTEPMVYSEDELKLIKKARQHYELELTPQQIAWRRAKIREKGRGGYENFLQEYPEDDQTCFISSGDAVFDGFILAALKAAVKPVLSTVDGIKIYKAYDKRLRYVIGADVAEGVASDYSAAKVLQMDTREEVASYRANKIKPGDFADKLEQMGNLYTTGGRPLPLIGVERNNHGHAVLLKLSEVIQYPHLFSHDDGRLGWLSNKVTRPLMIDTFIEGVESRMCRVNDLDTLNECLTLVDNKGKIEAAEGKNDDAVIAHAIALQMCVKEGAHSLIFDDLDSHIII